MKVCLLGDTHFGVRGDSVVFHNYFEKFYRDVMFPYLKKHDINTVFQLGDLFDKKKNVNFLTLSKARSYFFDPLRDNGMKLIVNVGNHDTYFKHSNEISAPDLLLRDYDNVHVISDPKEYDMDGHKLLILPWVCNDNLEEVKTLLANTSAQIGLGHLELYGFSMYKGVPNERGMDPGMFSRLDMVFTGHFHHRSSSGNIHYVGTPYELTWSDYDDPRGFHILDLDTREVTFIPNPYCIFHKIAYDDQDATLEDILDFDATVFTDCFVKVVAITKNNPYAYEAFIKKIEDAGAIDVKSTDNALMLELNDDEIVDVEDTLTLLRNVVAETSTTVPTADLEALMIELYAEASSMERA